MRSLLMQWLLAIPTLFSALYCTVFTLASCREEWWLFALLLPGCLLLWGCVVMGIVGLVGLCKEHELVVISRRNA